MSHSVVGPLPAGTPAPGFDLPSGPGTTVSLGDFRGRPVVLVFYPADWSPVCTDQLGLYETLLPEFQTFGDPAVLGISSRDLNQRSVRQWFMRHSCHDTRRTPAPVDASAAPPSLSGCRRDAGG